MTEARPHDEAENIRRMSPGDRISPHDHSPVAKSVASISGGLWLAIVATILALYSVHMATSALVQSTAAAERSANARRASDIAQLYSTQMYTELNRLGIPARTPADFDHELQPESDPALQER